MLYRCLSALGAAGRLCTKTVKASCLRAPSIIPLCWLLGQYERRSNAGVECGDFWWVGNLVDLGECLDNTDSRIGDLGVLCTRGTTISLDPIFF